MLQLHVGEVPGAPVSILVTDAEGRDARLLEFLASCQKVVPRLRRVLGVETRLIEVLLVVRRRDADYVVGHSPELAVVDVLVGVEPLVDLILWHVVAYRCHRVLPHLREYWARGPLRRDIRPLPGRGSRLEGAYERGGRLGNYVDLQVRFLLLVSLDRLVHPIVCTRRVGLGPIPERELAFNTLHPWRVPLLLLLFSSAPSKEPWKSGGTGTHSDQPQELPPAQAVHAQPSFGILGSLHATQGSYLHILSALPTLRSVFAPLNLVSPVKPLPLQLPARPGFSRWHQEHRGR